MSVIFFDQLVNENKISQEHAVRLKRRYNHLLEGIERLDIGKNASTGLTLHIKHMLV